MRSSFLRSPNTRKRHARQHAQRLTGRGPCACENLESRLLLSGITTNPLDPAALPQGITHDASGAVWYTDAQQGLLTKVTLDVNQNPVYTSFPVDGNNPSTIAYSSTDGNLYLAVGPTIEQFSTSGALLNEWNVVAPSDVNGATTPVELTVGGDGAVWYTTQGEAQMDPATGGFTIQNSFIGRLNVTTGNTTILSLAPTDGQTFGITTDPTGNVWFTMTPINTQFGDPNINYIGSAHIGRIAMSAGNPINYFNLPTSQGTLGEIRAAADGSIWYTSSDEVGDPRFATQPTPDLLGHGVFNAAGGGSLAITEYQIPKLGDQSGVLLSGLAIDSSGTVWVGEFLDGKITSFDPAAGNFTRYSLSGSTPGFMTASGSSVWITSPYSTTPTGDSAPALIRVDLNAVAPSVLSTDPDILATTGQPVSGSLVMFVSQSAGDFSYTVDYGNGQTASGTVAHNASGVYSIDASVTYAATGTYATHLTIADALGETVSLTGSAMVTDPITSIPLEAQGINIASQEDLALAPNAVGVDSVVVATFSGPVAAYSATINWGDSTTSTGRVVSLGNNNYCVTLPTGQQKVYANPGSYNLSVVITDGTNSVTATSTATITDTPLVASQNLLALTYPTTKDGFLVATFTDDIDATIKNFKATINWGDGTATTTGIIVADAAHPGSFLVIGVHKYKPIAKPKPGQVLIPVTYNVCTTITNTLENTTAAATGYFIQTAT